MKSIFKVIIPLLISAVVFSACHTKTNEIGKMIPSDAIMVMHMDGKSLSSKLTIDDIKQGDWYKQMMQDSSLPGWIKQLASNPQNSGMNIKGDFAFFIERGADGQMQFGFEGEVSDGNAFMQMNKNMDSSAVVQKDKDLSTMMIKDKAAVTWNDKRFAYVFITADKVKNYGVDDSVPTQPKADPGAMAAVSKSLFSLKADSSMSKTENFTGLLKEEGDVHFWYNSGQMMKSMPGMGMMGMLKLDALINNVITFTVNFEDGKIAMKQKFYGSKELMDIIKKYGTENIDASMISNIPSKNVAGVLAFKFKPQGLIEIIKLTGMDGLVNMAISKQGFTMDDVAKAMKGDFMLSVSDITVNDTLHKMPDILFSLSIGDKDAFNKVFNAGQKLRKDMSKDTSVTVAQNDKYFVAGNNAASVNAYLAGKSNSSFDFLSRLKDHPYGMFIDLNKIITTMNTKANRDSTEKAIGDASAKTWDNVYSTNGGIVGGAYVGESEVNFIDKKTNSLKQLNNYFNTIAIPMHEKMKQHKERAMVLDSIKMPDNPASKTIY